MPDTRTWDLILVGGGLANSLVALALAETRPELDLLVLERGDRIGGNHTWSFHTDDLTPEGHALVSALVIRSWTHYDVRFPRRDRRIERGYHSIRSPRLHDVVTGKLADRIVLGAGATEVRPTYVVLEDGRRFEARGVLDGRGWPARSPVACGYQKFVGLDLRTTDPHGLNGPVLMDATVPQMDGYRFMYVLPWSDRSLLVEETDYSNAPVLDPEGSTERILQYAAAHGWSVAEVQGREAGALPIPWSGRFEGIWADQNEGPARSGVSAGLFHPTTGYSLPDAVALALRLTTLPDLSAPMLGRAARQLAARTWRGRTFLRFLNRMMFRAAAPEERYRIFERFYGLSEDLIARFYAARLTVPDRVRLLAGRPPVPLGRAARCLFEAIADSGASSNASAEHSPRAIESRERSE